jgi:hypothetical protein
MFISRFFNKSKPHKVDSQAHDWLGMMEAESVFRSTPADFKDGMSPSLKGLVKMCLADRSVEPLLADLASPGSIWCSSMTDWWTGSGASTSEFSWNAAACYTVFLTALHGRRLSSTVPDVDGPFISMLQTPLTSLLASTGATGG